MKKFSRGSILSLNPLNVKIIAYIRARPCLWDKNNLQFRNTPLKNKEWAKLATQTHLTIEEVKSKWESMRQSFRQKVKRMKGSNESECNWPYFPFLLFLLKTLDEKLMDNARTEDYYRDLYDVDSFDVNSDDITIKPGNNTDKNEEVFKFHEAIIKNEPELLVDGNIESLEESYLDEVDMLNDDTTVHEDFDTVSCSGGYNIYEKSSVIDKKSENLEEGDLLFLLSFVDILKSFETQKQLQLRIRLLQTLNSEKLDFEKMNSGWMRNVNYPTDSCESIFLASLYPFLKIVPDYRKLVVRTKIADLFNNEIEPEFTAVEEYIES